MTEDLVIMLGDMGHELLLVASFMPLICVVILGGIYALVRRMD